MPQIVNGSSVSLRLDFDDYPGAVTHRLAFLAAGEGQQVLWQGPMAETVEANLNPLLLKAEQWVDLYLTARDAQDQKLATTNSIRGRLRLETIEEPVEPPEEPPYVFRSIVIEGELIGADGTRYRPILELEE